MEQQCPFQEVPTFEMWRSATHVGKPEQIRIFFVHSSLPVAQGAIFLLTHINAPAAHSTDLIITSWSLFSN
jgi:hypothetical protein